jgi:SWI/SNF-related matrix-associated actin-dependent regulator 1 of chromatin subfamily A
MTTATATLEAPQPEAAPEDTMLPEAAPLPPQWGVSITSRGQSPQEGLVNPISIACLLGGDEQARLAHNAAVAEALDEVKATLQQARAAVLAAEDAQRLQRLEQALEDAKTSAADAGQKQRTATTRAAQALGRGEDPRPHEAAAQAAGQDERTYLARVETLGELLRQAQGTVRAQLAEAIAQAQARAREEAAARHAEAVERFVEEATPAILHLAASVAAMQYLAPSSPAGLPGGQTLLELP